MPPEVELWGGPLDGVRRGLTLGAWGVLTVWRNPDGTLSDHWEERGRTYTVAAEMTYVGSYASRDICAPFTWRARA